MSLRSASRMTMSSAMVGCRPLLGGVETIDELEGRPIDQAPIETGPAGRALGCPRVAGAPRAGPNQVQEGILFAVHPDLLEVEHVSRGPSFDPELVSGR